jgi:hypothetical protein
VADPGQEEFECDGRLGGPPEVVLAPHQDGEDLFEKEKVGWRSEREGLHGFPGPSVAGGRQGLPVKGTVKNIPEPACDRADLGLGIDPRVKDCPGRTQGVRKIPLEQGGEKGFFKGLIGHTEKFRDSSGSEVGASDTKNLIQNGKAIPETSFCRSRQKSQHRRMEGESLRLGDLLKTGIDFRNGQEAESKVLATGKDGIRNLVRFCCGQNENGMGRRFLEGLEKGVEGRCRQHVDFIDDNDLGSSGKGTVSQAFPDRPDVLHAGVRGSVHFEHIRGLPFGNIETGRTGKAGRGRWSVDTIDGFGEYPGNSGFPDPSVSRKEIGLRQDSRIKSPGEGANHRFLSHKVGKCLGTIDARQRFELCHWDLVMQE